MLITILASIGLFFIITSVYKKGRRDGIKDAVDYFVTEMKKREIDAEIIIEEDIDQFDKAKILKLLPFFKRRN